MLQIIMRKVNKLLMFKKHFYQFIPHIALIMIMATVFHNRRSEMDRVAIAQFLFIPALFVVYGRAIA